MLISDETKEMLDKLIQRMFQHNRTWDAFLGFSDVNWAMSTFSKTFHKNLAHLFPLFADLVADIELRYNIVPKYYETKADLRIWDGMIPFFEANLQEHIETYEYMKELIDVAIVNGDINVVKDIDSIIRKWNVMIDQCYQLLDHSKMYGENNKFLFDGFSEQFYVVEEIRKELVGD